MKENKKYLKTPIVREAEASKQTAAESDKDRKYYVRRIDSLKDALDEAEAKIAELLEEIENIADEEHDGSDAQVSIIIIKKEEFQKLKEKYGEKK